MGISGVKLDGKKGIIMGVANKWSIAWGIAQVFDDAGASIAFTCANERFEQKLLTLFPELVNQSRHKSYICDVTSDESIEAAFTAVKNDFDKIDFLIHSIAFADKSSMGSQYLEVTRESFAQAMDISCYSFTAVVKASVPLLNDGASLMTMSYYGAEKIVANYNMMGVAKAALEASVRYLAADLGSHGIRVNAISPGTIKTTSAMGIGDFDKIGELNRRNSLLGRLVTPIEVGKSALYLASDLGSAITGEVIHVDAGYHAVACPRF
jgi:enoyl-[acyl-carrier protein] reductase I